MDAAGDEVSIDLDASIALEFSYHGLCPLEYGVI